VKSYQNVWVAEEVQTLLECVTMLRYMYIVSLVWGNSCKSQNIFTLQKKIVRLMVDARPTTSCTVQSLFQKSEILSVPCQ